MEAAVGGLNRCTDSPQILSNVCGTDPAFSSLAVTERRHGHFVQQFLALCIGAVDHRRCLGFLRQVFGKKTPLRLPIGIHIPVEIEVILAQIRKYADIDETVRDPKQVDGMRGDFKDGVGDAGGRHFGQNALQIR